MRSLYLGLESSHLAKELDAVCCPLIYTTAVPIDKEVIVGPFSYIILTSKESVKYLRDFLPQMKGQFVVVGKSTLKELNINALCPEEETQEGVLELLSKRGVSSKDRILYPRSTRARPFLCQELKKRGVELVTIDLYQTQRVKGVELPPLEGFDQIIFSSPSVVEAFFALKPTAFDSKKFYCIGSITQKKMDEQLAAVV